MGNGIPLYSCMVYIQSSVRSPHDERVFGGKALTSLHHDVVE